MDNEPSYYFHIHPTTPTTDPEALARIVSWKIGTHQVGKSHVEAAAALGLPVTGGRRAAWRQLRAAVRGLIRGHLG